MRLPWLPRPNSIFKYRVYILIAIFVFVLFSASSSQRHVSIEAVKTTVLGGPKYTSTWRIAKATMLYGGTNEIYERALESHVEHNKLHGYEMHVLRHSITTGFWNKFLWLQNVIVNELTKPKEERVDWIMWTDVSAILLNPEVPLSTFLPPRDNTSDPVFDTTTLIATKPERLSTSTFFLRVSPASLILLTKAMAAPLYLSNDDWGTAMDETSLEAVLMDPDHRDAVLYQPTHWYNLVVRPENTIEGVAGDLMVHFPGSLLGNKWNMMHEWMRDMVDRPGAWTAKFKDTRYPAETSEYWADVKKAKIALAEARSRLAMDHGLDELKTEVESLKEVLRDGNWDNIALSEAVAKVEKLIE